MVLSGGAITFELGLLARTWHTLGEFEPGFTNELVTVQSQLAAVDYDNLFNQEYAAAFGFPSLPATIRVGASVALGGD